jgi:DNA-binding protein HU-beta
MNKGELIDKIAAHSGLSKVDVECVINSFLAVSTAAMCKGDKIKFVDFGTLSVRKYAARTGRNPQTGAAIKIPASKRGHFYTGLELRKKLNKK